VPASINGSQSLLFELFLRIQRTLILAAVGLLKGLYRFGLHPRERDRPDDAGDLETKVFNHTLANPLGISSGLDKHGEIPTQLLALGPAVVEIGGVTPSRQSGSVPIGVLLTTFKGPGGSALFLKNISS